MQQTMRDWLNRRKLIDALGDFTPQLYGENRATLVEERLPWHTNQMVLSSELKNKITQVHRVLSELGFNALRSIEKDFMTDGSRVVLVDFGFDLGDPKVLISYR